MSSSFLSPKTARSIDDGSLSALLGSCVSDPARVDTGIAGRVAAAHDASHYLLTPQAVVSAVSPTEVGALMAAARTAGVPLTLRSGGHQPVRSGRL